LRLLLFEGVMVLGPAEPVPNSKVMMDIMRTTPFVTLSVPPSLLEDVFNEYKDKFKEDATRRRETFYGGDTSLRPQHPFLYRY
jgi:hypothetical protein